MSSRQDGARARFLAPPEGDEEQELWIYSYADLVTLLLGFFVIMQSFSTLNAQKFREAADAMSQAIEQGRDAPEEDTKPVDVVHQARALKMLLSMMNVDTTVEQAVERIEEQFARQSEEGAPVDIPGALDPEEAREAMARREDSGAVELVLPSHILFAPGDAALTDGARVGLSDLARSIAAMVDLLEVEIVGHTDGTVAMQTAFRDNFTLSSARAGSVAMFFISQGVDRRRIRVRGMADLEPLSPELTSDGRVDAEAQARNRRVQIKIRRAAGAGAEAK